VSGNFLEIPPVSIQYGMLAAQRLPALHDNVHVLRIDLQTVTRARE
jgi:hypothetical protein